MLKQKTHLRPPSPSGFGGLRRVVCIKSGFYFFFLAAAFFLAGFSGASTFASMAFSSSSISVGLRIFKMASSFEFTILNCSLVCSVLLFLAVSLPAKQALQYTGLEPFGRKGTSHEEPHFSHTALNKGFWSNELRGSLLSKRSPPRSPPRLSKRRGLGFSSFLKQLLQNTGLLPVGLKGTSQSLPHSLQTASYMVGLSKSRPPPRSQGLLEPNFFLSVHPPELFPLFGGLIFSYLCVYQS